MPELPEVETIRRDLARTITGSRIESVLLRDERVVRMCPQLFASKLRGRTVRSVHRRGKALLIDLQGLWLVIQPMMTGQVVYVPPGKKVAAVKETKAVFELSKGAALFYNDQRLFGRLAVVDRPEEIGYLRAIGPEPLERGFTSGVLAGQLRGRNVAIKTLLLDHKVVAGIGNIYASEILFRSGIAPKRKATSLKANEIARLHQAIKDVLQEAVRMRGTSMRNYRDGRGMPGRYLRVVRVYGRDGQPCLKCGEPVKRFVQAQRSTYYCAHCQR
jgi:formamidopyrimidine-DNA glycosylase